MIHLQRQLLATLFLLILASSSVLRDGLDSQPTDALRAAIQDGDSAVVEACLKSGASARDDKCDNKWNNKWDNKWDNKWNNKWDNKWDNKWNNKWDDK